MAESAIEYEIRGRLWRAGLGLRRIDRGVLVGVLLSIVPVPPIALVGMAIDIMNLRLGAQGRIAESDRRLAKVALLLSIISVCIGVALVMVSASLALHLTGQAWSLLRAAGAAIRALLENTPQPQMGRGIHSV